MTAEPSKTVKEEVLPCVLKYLETLGYKKTVKALTKEAADALKNADKAEETLPLDAIFWLFKNNRTMKEFLDNDDSSKTDSPVSGSDSSSDSDSDSESDSSSDSDSDSSSDNDSDSSSDSDSDSSSSSSSSSDSDSNSSSDSGSSSDSDSDSDSSSSSDSNSDSDEDSDSDSKSSSSDSESNEDDNKKTSKKRSRSSSSSSSEDENPVKKTKQSDESSSSSSSSSSASSSSSSANASSNSSPDPQLEESGGKRKYFSRIDRSKISFDDATLRDNTYKGAAGTWGEAANDKLGQVRGKDFTKNKNKMKKGSYRGGSITMASGSYKFED